MPISEVDGCPEAHWTEVFEIISDAIEDAGFESDLVSNADDVGIIQKRIIQNLYENPIVVCDVSGKNPNVMFELGIRLAFDKPTIIVKDSATAYSFDTAPIEHLEYPRDLRFTQIVDFKQKLSEKIAATDSKARTDPDYTTFLKHFGEFTVVKIDRKEVSGQDYIVEELRNIGAAVARLETRQQPSKLSVLSQPRPTTQDIDVCLSRKAEADILATRHAAESHPALKNVIVYPFARGDHYHLAADFVEGERLPQSELKKLFGPSLRRPRSRPSPNSAASGTS